MPDYRKVPKPCIGFTVVGLRGNPKTIPCPHGAMVKTRYAKRCKSCAAQERQHLGNNSIFMARIHSPNHKKFVARRMAS